MAQAAFQACQDSNNGYPDEVDTAPLRMGVAVFLMTYVREATNYKTAF